MRIALIAALSTNRVIGKDNDLPWHLPDDFRHFKRTTKGHHVIMGRLTWESRSQPLPKRVNLVLTSRPDYAAPGATIIRSLDEGLALASAAGDDEVFVIGGTALFAEALPRADRLYLTFIHAEIDGDAHFPEFDASQWREVDRVEREVDDRHAHAFSIVTLERASA